MGINSCLYNDFKQPGNRVYTKGKFLFFGKEKFYIKGVTYGTFAPLPDGNQFPEKSIVENDFALMASHGFNAVRTYTAPPQYLLDIALAYDLKVMVGLPWEQHITFLDSKKLQKDIIGRVSAATEQCNQHPAVLCYTIGNEIPSSIVRWYGKEKIEGFLKQLYKAVKKVDPESLVTYVNYPTTEYLDLSFLDFDCFNVYLETPEKLSNYISRLHNLSGDRPLVLAEIGLDSLRNGHEKQAEVLSWQIKTVFAKGCAGMFVFAWTDEWWRGGFEIEDWDFGLVDRKRNSKPALQAVQSAMNQIPCGLEKWPFITVAICSYNGSRTIRDTMETLQKLAYPNFEVVVVNDGSTDNFEEIVKQYSIRLISTANRGLGNARNTAAQYAKGEIIAFIDDDAYPDPHWLHYLAYTYCTSNYAGIGGPNLIPEEDGPIAHCVANAPGGPVHVLSTDQIAEHIPGCNMSFRRKAYLEVGGCDPVFRAAGDDVDLCWRIQEAGYTIGYHPSAVVWHHRRNSLRAYWKQQKGYGKAEALLENKWPRKYNSFGHLAWSGRIYGNGLTLPVRLKKGKIFHGSWGSALFQSIYQPGPGFITAFPLMPEWYLFVALLATLSLLSIFWSVLIWVLPLFISSIAVVFMQALASTYRNTSLHNSAKYNSKYILLITILHVIQPIARLYGRLSNGLTPWKKATTNDKWKIQVPFVSRQSNVWSEKWRASGEWLSEIEASLIRLKMRVKRGGDFDQWDIQIRNGVSSIGRALFTIEEHGAGKQLIKMRTWTKPSKSFMTLFTIFCALAIFSAIDGVIIISSIFSLFVLLILSEYILQSSITMHHFKKVLAEVGERENKFLNKLTTEEVVLRNKNILSSADRQVLLSNEHFYQKEEVSVELVPEIN